MRINLLLASLGLGVMTISAIAFAADPSGQGNSAGLPQISDPGSVQPRAFDDFSKSDPQLAAQLSQIFNSTDDRFHRCVGPSRPGDCDNDHARDHDHEHDYGGLAE